MAKITVVQTGSPIRRKSDQRATLVGLGLNRIGRRSVLEDTPAVRGMIDRVKHLVEVEEGQGSDDPRKVRRCNGFHVRYWPRRGAGLRRRGRKRDPERFW